MDGLAERIAAARLGGHELADAPTLSLEEGYAVQRAVAARLGVLAGWKVGATSEGGQRFLRIAEPIRGRVFSVGVVRSGEAVALPGDRAGEAEPEILFRVGPDPQGPPAAVHLGLEVNRPSHADALALGAGFIVADNAAHAGLVVGPELPVAALDRPAEVRVALFRNGGPASEGDAAQVLGHPLEALRWLARTVPLRAGDWVATGAMARACPFAPGDRVLADFGALGVVEAWRPAVRKVMDVVGE